MSSAPTSPETPAPDSRPEHLRLSAAEVHPRHALSGFALSPDGRQVALVQVRDRRAEEDRQRKRVRDIPLADLCLLPTGGGYPRPFTSSGDVSQPGAWSPDGSRLLLQRDGALRSVPLDGGTLQTVYRGALYRPRLSPGDAHLGGPRWSPGGDRVLLATREAPETTLLLVSADGSHPAPPADRGGHPGLLGLVPGRALGGGGGAGRGHLRGRPAPGGRGPGGGPRPVAGAPQRLPQARGGVVARPGGSTPPGVSLQPLRLGQALDGHLPRLRS